MPIPRNTSGYLPGCTCQECREETERRRQEWGEERNVPLEFVRWVDPTELVIGHWVDTRMAMVETRAPGTVYADEPEEESAGSLPDYLSNRVEITFDTGGDMPVRPTLRELAREEPMDVDGAPVSTTQSGELRHPFLTATAREKIFIITEIGPRDSHYRYRNFILNRPFYGVAGGPTGDGDYMSVSLRCMTRREELAPGIVALDNVRSFRIDYAKYRKYSIERRREVYEEYLRRVNPSLAELGEEFSFSIVPDDESKIKPRRLKSLLKHFGGMWIATKHPTAKYDEMVFLTMETGETDGRTYVAFRLVTNKGQLLPQGAIFTLMGNRDADLGWLHLSRQVSQDVPFRLVGDGEIEMRS